MYCVYGNHDLPQHSLEQSNKCGMFTLETAEKIEMLDECHWNMEPENGSLLYGNPIFPKNINQKVLIWHVMTYPSGKQPWPGCEDLSAGEILDKYPQFDLILCGHNHKTFIEEKDGRLLVNPGSLTRQNADQIDHKPSVFLWYAKSNRVEQVILPHEKNVISREHLDAPKKREGRLRAYIENMNTDWGAAWSFKDNLENHFRKNKSISKKIKDMIWKSIEK
jgi:DNA repair exonuclease SbcCD nuclease subunit